MRKRRVTAEQDRYGDHNAATILLKKNLAAKLVGLEPDPRLGLVPWEQGNLSFDGQYLGATITIDIKKSSSGAVAVIRASSVNTDDIVETVSVKTAAEAVTALKKIVRRISRQAQLLKDSRGAKLRKRLATKRGPRRRRRTEGDDAYPDEEDE